MHAWKMIYTYAESIREQSGSHGKRSPPSCDAGGSPFEPELSRPRSDRSGCKGQSSQCLSGVTAGPWLSLRGPISCCRLCSCRAQLPVSSYAVTRLTSMEERSRRRKEEECGNSVEKGCSLGVFVSRVNPAALRWNRPGAGFLLRAGPWWWFREPSAASWLERRRRSLRV